MQKFSGVKLLMGDLNTEPHSPTIRWDRMMINIVCTLIAMLLLVDS